MEPISTAATVAGLIGTCLKLLHKLRQSYEEYAEYKEKIDSTERELRAINGAINNSNSSAATDDDENGWIVSLEEIKREIEDSIDRYNFKVKRQADGYRYRGLIPRGANALFGPWKMLLEDIEAINRRIKEVNDRAKRYQHAGETSAGSTPYHYQHLRVADPEGLGTYTAELVQMLRNKQKVVGVAISGPSGSGKSVLAQAVCRQVERDFKRKAWVSATSSPDPNDLIKGITQQLGFEQPPPFKDPGTHLREKLIRKQKRCIIGIEEIESKAYWGILANAFPDGESSIRIIVTTRTEDVAQHCSKHCQVYKMPALDQSSARNLLLKTASFNERREGPSDLDEGLVKILETCEYLPVAIANMGVYMKKSLSTRWNKHHCEEICKDIVSLLVNNKEGAFTGVKHVFDSSYASLSYRAKICLLSLISACPNVEENGCIKRKSMIRRWLAERLIEGTNTHSAEEVANECFTALVNHNFIVPVKVSVSAQIKTFRVHRMMLPFIKERAISRRFVTRLDIHQGKKVEPHVSTIRLCLYSSSTDYNAASRDAAIDLCRIRLLTFHGKASNALKNFRRTVFLRVLVLENIENLKDGHLDAICRPSMLKYLSIRGNKYVTKLPKNIVDLRMLETLDTRDTSVRIISMDLIRLPELLHLFGEFQIVVTSKRERIRSKLLPQNNSSPIENSKLKTLAGFFIDESLDYATLLRHMPMLSKIRILYRNKSAPSNKVIQDLLDCLKICLEKKPDGSSPLYSLSIDFRGCNLNFLDGLKKIESPCFLHSLKLGGKLTKLPDFILSLQDSLQELSLLEIYLGGSVLSELGRLKNLQFLKLTEDPPFEKATSELTFQDGWFNSLKRLCLNVPKIPKIVIQEHAMEDLESLQLFCKELGGFSGILHLKRLNEVILPTNVSGAGVDGLLQQVGNHGMKPKLLDVDGSSWPMEASYETSSRWLHGKFMRRHKN
ncbi:hypothetical protein U9M48_001639 [Paspalum notatum var. saurae]|uniref:AAA+ ATPase domain-containing protein n=1 Tax=Paspalum notatum var. saurae TaxID=547442 RepID=A0AAQ3PIL3_PASNO